MNRKSIAIMAVFAMILPGLQISLPVSGSSVLVLTSHVDFGNGTYSGTTVIGINDTAKLGLSKKVTDVWTAAQPQARGGHALAPIYGTDRVFLYGGYSWGEERIVWDDSWYYDNSSNFWYPIKTADPRPSARYRHSLAAYNSEAKILLFGGINGTIDETNETWVFDYASGTWTLQNPASAPRKGFSYSMAMLPTTEKAVLFGGCNWALNGFNETWIYDTANDGWTNAAPKNHPDGRYGASMVPVFGEDRVLLFGGWCPSGRSNETWVYDYSDNNWTRMNPAVSPPTRHEFGMAPVYDDDKVVIFGGSGNADQYQNDTWVYDIGDNAWTNRTPEKTFSHRDETAMAPVYGTADVVLFGGALGSNGPFADTYGYNTTTNKWTSKDIIPYRGYQGGLAALNGTDCMVYFGGYTEYGSSNETWIYNTSANTWTLANPEKSPGATGQAVIAPVSTDDKAVLLYPSETWVYDYSENNWTSMSPAAKPVGGTAIATVFNDDKVLLYDGENNKTWTYDLSDNNWTDKKPVTAPDKRKYTAISPVSDGDHFVMFSGEWASKYINDTWVYSLKANNWTKMAPSSGPLPRSHASMATINSDDKVLLYAGDAAGVPPNTRFADSWIYDLSEDNWSQKADRVPPARSYFAMSAFPGRDGILMFGAYANSNPFHDAPWIFRHGDYVNLGDFISKPFDTGGSPDYFNLTWNASLPAQTAMSVQMRTAPNSSSLASKGFVGPDGNSSTFYNKTGTDIWSGHDGDRWVQFKVLMSTNDTAVTPLLEDLTLRYDLPPGTNLTKPPAEVWTNDSTPEFEWNFSDVDSSGQQKFRWQADGDSGFSSVDYDSGEVASNNTTYVPGQPMADGTWHWRVKAMDTDGVWGAFSACSTVRIDTVPPAAFDPIANPATWTNGTVTISYATQDNLSGMNAYSMRIDDGMFFGQESPCVLSNLSDGIHKIIVRAADNASNYYDGQVTVYIDRTPPRAFVPVAEPASWTNGEIRVLFCATDDVSAVGHYDLAVDGSEPVNATSPHVLPKLADGRHNISVRAFDLAGNFIEGKVPVFADSTPPEDFRVQASTEGWTQIPPRVTFSATDQMSGVSGYSVQLDNAGSSLQTSPYQLPAMEDGTHLVTVKAVDKANNSRSANTSVYIDHQPPAWCRLTINNGAPVTNTLRVSLSVDAFDNTSGIWQMCFQNAGGAFTDWENFSALKSWDLSPGAGEKTVLVKVRDRAGNLAGPSEARIVYDPTAQDSTPPEISNITPTDGSAVDDSMPTVGADYSDAATGNSGINLSNVKLSLDGMDVTGSSTVGPSGIRYVPRQALSAGMHHASLEVTDKSSKGNRASLNWSFTVTDAAFIAYIVIDPPVASVVINESVQFSARAFDPSGRPVPGVNISWKASGDIGAVDSNGLFTAVKLGKGSVVASYRSLTVSANLTVLGSLADRPVAVVDSILPNPAEYNETVTFQGHGTSKNEIQDYLWTSDRLGVLGTSRIVKRTRLPVGENRVSFLVRDADGVWSAPVMLDLTVFRNQAPVVGHVELSSNRITFGETVDIRAVGSSDPENGALKYFIDYGDGFNSDWMDSANVSYEYQTAGQYIVRFKVKDRYGAESDWSPAVTLEVVKKKGPEPAGFNMLPIIGAAVVIVAVCAGIGVYLIGRRKAGQGQKK
jgi:N-acetylneuraminic acid mutarotase